ncbi:hypothetical protein SDC9_21810 [bioreactor metagenome]|uniref:Uncharacterized protein n=1 Tax=bioreactor metagenome TaxID=1076179 RepID=A0A644UAE7_9ZZZZ|nr:hypothetical protein [Lentimicrobium sp.]MEA5111547.1 hypothetical protein [Lentimicrobium sp.]
MKKIVGLFICSLLMTYSFGQCNTTIEDTEESFSVIHAKEKIYNDDNRNQQVYSISFEAGIIDYGKRNPREEGYTIHQFFLISVIQKYSSNLFVPRKIIFYLKDGQQVEMNAIKMSDSEDAGYGMMQLCLFDFELSENAKSYDDVRLSTFETLKIEIIDYREGITITCNPYSKLIMEQLKCIDSDFAPYFRATYRTTK